MTNKAYLIKSQICKVGNVAYLADGSWSSMPFYCTLQQTWRRNKSDFQQKVTPIGKVSDDYYLFICPFDCDITALSEDAVLSVGGVKYEFLKREAVMIDSKIIYYNGVVKKLRETRYD